MTDPLGGRRDIRYSTEGLAAHLGELVVSGELGEGEKLPSERRLAEELGVSRPVVREALRRLEERGLIEVVPGRGAFVRGTGSADAMKSLGLLLRRKRPTPRELVEARRMLECEAASLAAVRGDGRDLRVMEEALERFEGGKDLLQKVGHDLAFHASIVSASRNPVVEVMFASIAGFVAELMLRSLGDPNVSREGLPYHYEIYEAVKERDAGKARSAVAGHLLVTERIYGADFDRPLEDLTRERLGYRLDMEEILDSLSSQDGRAESRR